MSRFLQYRNMHRTTDTEIHVGDRVALPRSGHSCSSAELGTVVALLETVVRVRWPDGRETFVPRTLVEH